MAASFARIKQLNYSDIIDEFFNKSWAAEVARHKEYNSDVKLQAKIRGYMVRLHIKQMKGAALKIQRVFRGYKGRERAKAERARINHEALLAFWNKMTVKIQKIWKGYWSRKAKFDYYARKKYLADVVVKMEELRIKVSEHAKEQEIIAKTKQAEFEAKIIEKLSGQRHHLVGTKAIPGVMSKAKQPLLSKKVEYQQDVAEEMLQETKILRLPPLSKLPEQRLKESNELKAWVQATVGTNHRNVKVKAPAITFSLVDDQKQAQGPFLPKTLLEVKRGRPLRPTLRVETDFYDTYNFWKERREKEVNTRISDKNFITTKHVRHPQSGYFLGGGPYTLRQTSKKGDSLPKPTAPKFKNVLAPVPLFDDMMDLLES
ncbi:spermatogenesis-associated protein 17 [Rhizoclosmatium sp. JEL0117]|nr:spermatogenesis-associated protein 17 [Rhizoclosmatium sp. JEL0117]